MHFSWEELRRLQVGGKLDSWDQAIPPTCGDCGYNLLGLRSNRCPECGASIDLNYAQQRIREMKTTLSLLSTANRKFKISLGIAIGGWLLLLLVRMPPGWMPTIVWSSLGGVAILGALVGAIMAYPVLHVRKLPPWAREMIGPPPPNLTVGDIALGLNAAMPVGIFLAYW